MNSSAERVKAWREANKEHVREYQRRYKQEHPEYLARGLENLRKWKQDDPERAKESNRQRLKRRREADPQANRDRVRQWRIDNPEKYAAQLAKRKEKRANRTAEEREADRQKGRVWRSANAEQVRQAALKWQSENRERINAQKRQRGMEKRRAAGITARTKLTDEQVIAIRRFVAEGGRKSDAARIWQVDPGHITRIVAGASRANVQPQRLAA